MTMKNHIKNIKKWVVFVMRTPRWEYILFLIPMIIGLKSFLKDRNSESREVFIRNIESNK